MTAAPRPVIVPTWYAAFLLEEGTVRATEPAPHTVEALVERTRARLDGRLTPEESRLLARAPEGGVASPDRRIVAHGATLSEEAVAVPAPDRFGVSAERHREVLLAVAAERLRGAWDPSLHVEEAVRAMSDLDRVVNLVAERLTSWAGRDALVTGEESGEDPDRIARAIVAGSWATSSELPGVDPALAEGRRALARLLLETRTARATLESAVLASLPARAPNLSALLGPALAARLISQAGGLDRLARLPASTVQVLGAERAFFEHLRGRGSSPRHGLLFLHPKVQSSRRAQRGRIARALAGKAAIAARLDLAGAAVRPELAAAFEQRADAVRAAGGTAGPVRLRRAARRSGRPLDRAAEDR